MNTPPRNTLDDKTDHFRGCRRYISTGAPLPRQYAVSLRCGLLGNKNLHSRAPTRRPHHDRLVLFNVGCRQCVRLRLAL
ncbi:hypothetical protein E2C01_102178 [Portunus trituberculatus]|uniref:Uncharacterized protein n=1 Tax=Portunus trituberculatus TaxID=210409 RepID=A0A5B7KGN6_PORTR|nr:hypothetical protein [Portunus trituberculatus]